MSYDDGEEGGKLKPRKTSVDDDFMQHPDSGAYIRNPLKEKAKSQPILLSASEFNHNCLDETLGEWHCVSVSESSFRDMMNHFADTHGTTFPSSWSRTVSAQSRCSVGRVHSLSGGFDFVVQLRKSTYVAPRKKAPRPSGQKDAPGVMVDKVNMEVSDIDGMALRVENITEGLILAWNRTHPSFPVKIGDVISRVNDKKRNSAAMIEEMQQSVDLLRLTVHRTPAFAGSRSVSKEQRGSMMMSLAGEGTMLPGPHGEFSAGSLAKPGRKSSKTTPDQ